MPDESHLSSQQRRRIVLVGVTLLVVFLSSILLLPFRTSASAAVERPVTSPASQDSAQTKSPISIDYPEDGSIFPPGITPPTFIWRDSTATSWHITVSFGSQAPAIHALSHGERIHIGPIDPECVSSSNEPPSLTPQQAAS